MRCLILLFLVFYGTNATYYYVQKLMHGIDKSEIMFSNGDHSFRQSEESFVHVNLTATLLEEAIRKRNTYRYAIAIYIASADYVHIPSNLCSMKTKRLSSADSSAFKLRAFKGQNNTFKSSITMDLHYLVANSGPQRVVVQTCRAYQSNVTFVANMNSAFREYTIGDPVVHFEAALFFRNPHGPLAATLYWLLPFYGMLAIANSLAVIFYAVLIIKHRRSVEGFQFLIFCGLCIMSAQTATSFFTYFALNENGGQICCPLPYPFVISAIIKAAAEAFARWMIWSMSLGMGPTRKRTSFPEKIMFLMLMFCFSCARFVLEIAEGDEQANEVISVPQGWLLLEFCLNMALCIWIGAQLTITKTKLRLARQDQQLRMYSLFSLVLLCYVVILHVCLLAKVIIYHNNSSLSWRFGWGFWIYRNWINFTVLIIVAFIWRPTATSYLYTQAQQLPAEDMSPVDDDEDEEIEVFSNELVDKPMKTL